VQAQWQQFGANAQRSGRRFVSQSASKKAQHGTNNQAQGSAIAPSMVKMRAEYDKRNNTTMYGQAHCPRTSRTQG